MDRYPLLKKILTSDYLKLVLILGLAFYIASIPHQGYSYPVHLDEWNHWGCANEIIKEGKAFDLTNPYYGGVPIWNQLVEVGFHTFIAVFHQIGGIDWLFTFKYFPSIIFLITVLTAYILGKKMGFGWEAALLTCLIPTTVGVLGPGFLVPVAMGLFFIALSIYLVINHRGWGAYLTLTVFMLFLLSMHAATTVGLAVIVAPYLLLNLRRDFKHSLIIFLAFVVPFILAILMIPGIWDTMVLRELRNLFKIKEIAEYIDVPQLVHTYGYIPVLFCLLGAFVLSLKKGIKNYSLVLGLLVVVFLLTLFNTFGYGIALMYYRGVQYAMLMIGIVAGAGLMSVKDLKISDTALSYLRSNKIRAPGVIVRQFEIHPMLRNAGYLFSVILIAVMLFVAIPDRNNIRYYHMIDDNDYAAFTWIKENVDSSYDKAVLDPWKGTAFTAITGKKIYARIFEFATAREESAYQFLAEGSANTAFLKDKGISIVYSTAEVNNPALIEVRDNVYLLKKE